MDAVLESIVGIALAILLLLMRGIYVTCRQRILGDSSGESPDDATDLYQSKCDEYNKIP